MSNKKIFYMIRHGESVLNAEHIRQGRAGALSELGRQQADMTGERLSSINFDVMLVSPFQRTVETSEIIAKHLKLPKPPEYVELLSERRNPTEIINQSALRPEIKQIIDTIDNAYHSDDFRYSDEENFTDLRDRATALLDYLAHRPEEKVLVVTHSIFLKMIAAVINSGPKLTAKKYNLMSFLNSSNNASITVCECEEVPDRNVLLGWLFPKKKKVWKVLAWDDYTRGA
ncbi:MAG: histidine phosphatase family protein [bacterium]